MGKKWEAVAGGSREHGKSWEGDGKQRKPWESGNEEEEGEGRYVDKVLSKKFKEGEAMEELASGNPEKRPKTRRQEYRQAS